MDKDLAQYRDITKKRVEIIEDKMSDAKLADRQRLILETQAMFRFHTVRVRDFQHERLIHLLVTFFFGILVLLSMAGGLGALLLAADPVGSMLNILAWTLSPLLFVTELFYIGHYYKLENGVQALYVLTKRLQAILDTK